jgi:hypothetical protein
MDEKKDPGNQDRTGLTKPQGSSLEEEEKVEEQGDACKAKNVIKYMRSSLEDHIKQINPMPAYTRPVQRQAWGDVQVS